MAPPESQTRRTYDRFCPLSLALDQVGDRWTLHVVMALLGGPRRYSELKRVLRGAGTNILSDRLRGLAAHGLITRTTGNAPGSETRYQLTPRGGQLGPVIGGLATWGLEILIGTAPGSREQAQQVFDRAWTVDEATAKLHESYQWRIDGVDFELAVQGDKLVRTPGRCARPAVTLMATNSALADLVTGRRSVAEAVESGHLELKGSKAAIRRMFEVIGFPLVRLGF
jgi:DNA-binding HxlR family transcriptional regulator/putative sterol carrier protein